MSNDSTKPRMQGYPLGAVFLLIAIVACMIAQFSFREIRGAYTPAELALAVGWGGFFGLIFGAIIGLYHYRRTRGFFLGCGAGLLVGAATGPICYFGIRSPWPMVISASVGGAGLICFAVVYRYINSSDPIASFANYSKLLPESTPGSVDVQGMPARLLERAIAAAIVCSTLSGFAHFGAVYLLRSPAATGSMVALVTQATVTAAVGLLLFGVPAIMYSMKARKHKQNGVSLRANYAAEQAMTWIRILVGYLLAAFAIALCVVVVGYLN